jgi:hypothetical protein
MNTCFTRDGFARIPAVISYKECESLAALAGQALAESGGSRSLLSQPWCAALAHRLRDCLAAGKLVPPSFVAVQCTFFEKSAENNWLVAIHQDPGIPVAIRVSAPTLQGWSEKEGTIYVHAPDELLDQLVAARVHLDPCTEQDGPLRVVPGTHSRGRLNPLESLAVRDEIGEITCTANRGDVLVMRPLLLHASSKSHGTSRRRVLHFLFGPRELPFGLQWRWTS